MGRVLVTGGAGFIGSYLCERFLNAGEDVVVIDDLSTGSRDNLPAGVDLRVVDVGSPEAAGIVAAGAFDVIAHFAAQMDVRKSVADPHFDARTNILGSLNLLEAVRKLPSARRPRFVFASTGGAYYGDHAALPSFEDTAANPDAPYGVAKLAVEHYLAYYDRIWGLDTVALRFGNVYGPRQNPQGEAGVISIFAGRIAAGQPVTVFGTGRQTRDFIFVSDVAEAFFAASKAELPPPGPINSRAFNIGTEVEVSVLELIDALGRIAGVKPQIEFKPARPGEVDRSLLGARKIRQLLPWKPEVTLDDGLARTYEWVSRNAR